MGRVFQRSLCQDNLKPVEEAAQKNSDKDNKNPTMQESKTETRTSRVVFRREGTKTSFYEGGEK